jgi:ATP-binding cassette subfamily C protein LapB
MMQTPSPGQNLAGDVPKEAPQEVPKEAAQEPPRGAAGKGADQNAAQAAQPGAQPGAHQNAPPDAQPAAAGQSPGAAPHASTATPAMMRWAEAILLAAKHLEVTASPEALRRAAAWSRGGKPAEEVPALARAAGLEGTFAQLRPSAVPRALWPFIVEVDDNLLLITEIARDGTFDAQMWVGGAVTPVRKALSDLGGDVARRVLLLQPPDSRTNERVGDYAPAFRKDWLRDLFASNRGVIAELSLGSLVGNLLGIATALFSMQVWDRVVPARSLNTLWVLALGVALALTLEYGLRVTRASITDRFGKLADLRLSDFFYARLLDIRNDARPRSPGSLIAQMRDFEQVRELLTSTAFGVLLDIPFVLAFIGVIGLLGGKLALVPLVAAPLVVLPGILAQRALAKLSTEGMGEAALRNAILMESVYRVEDIKGLQAEARFRALWHKTNQRSGEISLRQRRLASMLVSFSATTQNLAYAGTIIVGVYGVLQGALSTGTVIACSILTSRTLAPLAQIPAALSRLQNARVAKEGLDRLLTLPVDHDQQKERYHKPALLGRYRLEKVQYAYGPDDGVAFQAAALAIEPGERIAVLGRSGSGKSTLLRLLAGLAQPQQGRIVLDDTPMDLIDVADVRRSVGCLLQDASLFYGTLRENLLLGAPLADGEAAQRALRISCADRLLLQQPRGLDLKLRESGVGLSGGQKQALMLARLLLRDPQILLLDEPTASLDEGTEQQVIKNIGDWLGPRTLVVATHRYSILSIVQRVIVVDGGRIVLDGPRDAVLARLTGKPAPGQPAAAARPAPRPTAPAAPTRTTAPAAIPTMPVMIHAAQRPPVAMAAVKQPVMVRMPVRPAAAAAPHPPPQAQAPAAAQTDAQAVTQTDAQPAVQPAAQAVKQPVVLRLHKKDGAA